MSKIVLKRPNQEDIAPLASRMHLMIADSDAIQVIDQQSAKTAADMAKAYRGFLREAEEKRKELTQPILAAKQGIDAMFKPYKLAVMEAQSRLDEKLLAWRVAEDARIQAENKEREAQRIKEAALVAEDLERRGMVDEAEKVLDDAVVTRPHEKRDRGVTRGTLGGAAHVRKRWAFEVEDLSKVPTEYLQLNEKAVREAIKLGKREIPGLNIYQKEHLAVR